MSRHGLTSRKHRYWVRLQWAPVLRAVRELAITARQDPAPPEGHRPHQQPSIKTATRRLLSAVQTWHGHWSAYRTTAGRKINEGEYTPQTPPTNHFHRLQRACKAYGHSRRKDAARSEKLQARKELMDCAMEAPLGTGPFNSHYSSDEWCRRTLGEFPDLGHPKKPTLTEHNNMQQREKLLPKGPNQVQYTISDSER